MRLIQGNYEENISYCRDTIKEDFFEFDFPFVPMDTQFREIDRFLWESKHQCTRFKNRFEGQAVIDITDWNAVHPNDYFDAFLYFLKGNEDHLSCTLITSEPCTGEVMNRISKLFTVKEVNLLTDSHPQKKMNTIGFCADTEEENDYV